MEKKNTEAKIINFYQEQPKSVLEIMFENLKELDQELNIFFEKNKTDKPK